MIIVGLMLSNIIFTALIWNWAIDWFEKLLYNDDELLNIFLNEEERRELENINSVQV